MSALSKILPLLTSREARRTTTERPTNVLSATVPPVCSSAADSADLARLLPFLSAIAPPFLPFCEQEKSRCALRARTCAPPEFPPPTASLKSPGAATEYSPRVPTMIAPPKFFFAPCTAPTRSQATAPHHRCAHPKREPQARARSPPHIAHVAVAGNLCPESVLRAAHAVYAAVESNRRPLNFIFASRAIVRRQAKCEPHENEPGQVVAPVARGGQCRSAGAFCRSQVSEGRYSGNGHLDLTIVSPSCFPIRFSPQRSHIIRNVGRCRKVIHQEGDRMWPPKRVSSRN